MRGREAWGDVLRVGGGGLSSSGVLYRLERARGQSRGPQSKILHTLYLQMDGLFLSVLTTHKIDKYVR